MTVLMERLAGHATNYRGATRSRCGVRATPGCPATIASTSTRNNVEEIWSPFFFFFFFFFFLDTLFFA